MAWRIDLASGSGPGFATARAIDLDEEGNIYLAGAASVEPFGADLLVAKLNPEGTALWEATYGGTAGAFDEALAVTAGGGSVFALGRADNGEGTYDGVLVRFDAATGDIAWAVPLEGLVTFNDNLPSRVALDGLGGVFVAGAIRDGGAGSRPVITRFSSDGAVVWTNTQSAVRAESLFSDGSGGVYVVAQGELTRYGPKGEVVGTPSIDIFHATLAPGGDLHVLAFLGSGILAIQSYTAEGDLEWEAPFDFSEADFIVSSPLAMAVDEAGNTFVVTGRFGGWSVVGGLVLGTGPEGIGAWSAMFDAKDLSSAFLVPDGVGGAYVAGTGIPAIDPVIQVARFGTEGDLLWTLERGTDLSPAYLGAAIASNNGHLLIAATEGDATSPARVATVLAFDPQGALADRTDIEGAPTSLDYVTDVAPAPDGGVYVGGITWTSDGGYDLFLARVAHDGTVLWAAALDDGGFERPYDIAVAHDGGVVVAGVSGDFECIYATNEPDECDIFVAAYGPNGDPLWSGRWDGGSRDYPVGVVPDGQGGAFVGGLSVPGSGDADAVALRFDAAEGLLWEERYTGLEPALVYPIVGVFALANGDSPNGIVLAGTDSGYNGVGGLIAAAFGPDGQPLWEAHFDGPVDGDLARAAAAAGSASGRTYVSGVVEKYGVNGTVTVVFGPDGSEEWSVEVPFETIDVAVGPTGAAHLVGADHPWQPFTTSYSARVTSEGPTWTATFGPGSGTSVEVNENGYSFVTGSLTRSLLETDAALRVYGQDGDEVWSTELEAREAHAGGPYLVLSGDNAYVALTERASRSLQGGYWGWTAYATVALWQIDTSALPLDLPVEDEPEAAIFPARLNIGSVSPNPIRGNARISLEVAEPEQVRVEVFDVLGRRVAVLHDGWLGGGTHALILKTGGVAAGPYVIRAESSNGAAASQLVTIVN